MGKTKDTKRENFDVSPEQQAAIENLQQLVDAPSKKDAMLLAINLALHVASEVKKGNHLFIGDASMSKLKRIVMLGIEQPDRLKWTFLVERSHPWKKQLFVKGRKLPASSVWSGMIANNMTLEEAADNWELPVEAISEILAYCEENRPLLEMEANEELRRLEEKGIGIGA